MKHKNLYGLMITLRLAGVMTIFFAILHIGVVWNTESAVAATSPQGVYFVHTATVANTVFQVTYIDHPLTNGNPNAIVLVTQNWNPGGVGGIYNNHQIGVWYDSVMNKWSIFNQDIAPMPAGAAFNVLIVTAGENTFIHTATIANINHNLTHLDHPLINGNPNAILLVTQNWNPGGVGGIYNNHQIGVWYYSVTNKWTIFNQDEESMPAGAAFNVLIVTAGENTFIHTATVANIASNVTYIDHPLTNGNPNAIVIVTQNWNPSAIFNDPPIGVGYDDSTKQLVIFNQDSSAMPAGAAFNVLYLAAPFPWAMFLPAIISGEASSPPQPIPDTVTGFWEVYLTPDSTSVEGTKFLELHENSGSITGNVWCDPYPPTVGGNINGQEVRITLSYPRYGYTFQGTINGLQMNGTYTAGSLVDPVTGTWRATKKGALTCP